ncbi:isoprenylcysteine carboxylmethyltransferase family protein [Mycolicibacterium neoaurum]|uniref:isoprenylcysteine carboxyl methyltransferase family protein n=1 Tax=Mycolicibacterium neoaurum TaxID=1795 RepID=UPI00248BFC40|nr:isoprenylcysteine carboxylmethyltransferase family protein [Mycolicibacterium neoaurum]WBP92576.1 isoprenylcysteine carboxylmethyltransferase family protein [Mycolicibacterium neoaurum]WBS06557.1 isoprenylcysteine carboxylmethyltransferase family protein [Mycolicibacterium neoaurum]
MRGFIVLIALVAVERVAELVVSNRNLTWSKANGGKEFGAEHYPVMVALHTGLLAGALAEARVRRRWVWPAFWGVIGAQLLRWWCITTLGKQWNTRVVVVPGAPRVTGGPYRLMPHPNYVAVVLEGAALPLAGGAWITAAVFSIANALLLRTRIRVEDDALQSLT